MGKSKLILFSVLASLWVALLSDWFFISLAFSTAGFITGREIFTWISIGLALMILLGRVTLGKNPEKRAAKVVKRGKQLV